LRALAELIIGVLFACNLQNVLINKKNTKTSQAKWKSTRPRDSQVGLR